MLKSFIQLFAETFLKGKKSWIGNQAYCGSNFVSIPVTVGIFNSYSAPSDGIFSLAGSSCEALDIIVQGSYLRVNLKRPDKQILAGYVPLSKGQQVDYLIVGDESQSNSAKFIPSFGSS